MHFPGVSAGRGWLASLVAGRGGKPKRSEERKGLFASFERGRGGRVGGLKMTRDWGVLCFSVVKRRFSGRE